MANDMSDSTMYKRSVIILALLLAACAHAPGQHEPGQAALAQPTSASKAAAADDVSDTNDEQAVADDDSADTAGKQNNLPKQDLTGDMLYGFLLGDVAEQRGNQALAAQTYLELANATQDRRVARRAAQLAFEARQMEQAVAAFKLWVKLEPDSLQAKQLLLSVLISGDKLEDARPYIVDMLAEHPDKAGHALRQIYPLLAQHPDKEAVYKLVADLAQPYADEMEMHLVLAQAAAGASNYSLALTEARKARQLRSDSGEAAQLEAQLLYKETPQQGLGVLNKFLAAHSDVGDTRLTYARMLLAQKQYAESREQFKILLAAHPKNPDSAFAVAMLSLEMGDLDLAEHALHQSLDNGKKDASTVYFHLGQLNETRKRDTEALQNYRLVTDGDNAYGARLRVVYLLYKGGQLEEAREYLRQTGVRGEQQRVQVTLAEAQLLRDAKQPVAAYDVLEQGMKQSPDNVELMYEAALMAEPLGKLDAFEQLLRKVIEIKPDHAQAYNALA